MPHLDLLIEVITKVLGQTIAALVHRLLAKPAPPALPALPPAKPRKRRRRAAKLKPDGLPPAAGSSQGTDPGSRATHRPLDIPYPVANDAV